MDSLTEWLIAFVSEQDNLAGLAALAGSAMFEYVFPPFPGDTITLFGAVLITAYGWNFFLVLGAVMLGSLLGAWFDFWVGTLIEHRRRRYRIEHGQDPEHHRSARIDRLVEKFHRHGAMYLVLNRFLPGVRPFFFIAAAMSGVRLGTALFFGTLSALIWNLAIIAVGAAVGANFDDLQLWVGRYAVAVWTLVGLVALGYLVRWGWRRARAARARRVEDAAPPSPGPPSDAGTDAG